MRAQQLIENLFLSAGITVNGDKPYDIQVHDKRFYRLIAGNAQLGLGESYMDGWWDCDQLDEFINRILILIQIK